MYPVSSKYTEIVQQTARGWDIYIDILLQDGTALKITKEEINLGTPILKEGATCTSAIQVGSTYSNSFEFTLLNSEDQFTHYDFYKAIVKPFVGLDITGEQDFEYVPLGVFHIIEPVKKFSTISIVCFDNMSTLNQVFDFSQMLFPTHPLMIFDEIVTQTGIKVKEALREKIAHLHYTINSLLTNDPTCRDILAGFGIMLQENLRFDREGTLESFWYNFIGVATDKTTRVGNSSYGDNQINITGVYLEDTYGNTFSVGTDEYPVELPTSPIIQGSEMSLNVLEATWLKLKEVAHRPCTVTWIGDPAVQAGDILEHLETAVGNITLPIMRLVYKFANTETLESLGVDGDTNKQQSSTDRKLKKAFSLAENDRKELETKIEQTAENVLIQVAETYATKEDQASMQFASDQILAEVSKQSQEIEGAIKNITSVQQTATELSISIQQIQDSGAEKVVTKNAKYTFDDEGLRIASDGEEMSNMLDNTGMYVTRSGEIILQANNAGVIATDVTVRNYLIIGTHARFEDYKDGTDMKRTACFYIS